MADLLLEWGFVALALLSVGGFLWASVKGQRNIEEMQQRSGDLRRAEDQPPGVDGSGGLL